MNGYASKFLSMGLGDRLSWAGMILCLITYVRIDFLGFVIDVQDADEDKVFLVALAIMSVGILLLVWKAIKEGKRISQSPRIKRTAGQINLCGAFSEWTSWNDAILINGPERQREMTVSYNLGKTQNLCEIEVIDGILQVRSILDRTILGDTNV